MYITHTTFLHKPDIITPHTRHTPIMGRKKASRTKKEKKRKEKKSQEIKQLYIKQDIRDGNPTK